MSEDDLKNLEELNSKKKPRILTMYFEDGGETFVVPYEDYEKLEQENTNLKQALIDIREFMIKCPELTCAYEIRRDINDIIDKVSGDDE